LVVARGVQGVGGALLVPGSLALISANFSEGDRGRAIGTWSGFTSITAAVGPVLEDGLPQHGSWRWVFFINVPVGLAVLLLTARKVPESGADQRRRFDWAGGLLAVPGLGGIVFALINSRPTIGLAGATLLTGVFQTALDRKLSYFGVLPAERAHIEAQRQGLSEPKQMTRSRAKRSMKLLLRAIALCCGLRRDSHSPAS
jgi:MFS family permease